MTEPPGAGHLDLDALADALAGQREGDAHLRACSTCADRLDELAAAEVAVVASLATLPQPAVPAGLAERLAAALQAEGASPGSVTPLRPAVRRPPRRSSAWLSSAAACLVLVLAGGLGLAVLGALPLGGSSGSETSTDGGSSGAGGTGGGGGAGGAEAGGAGAGGAAAGGAEAGQEVAGVVVTASGVDYADPAQRTAALRRVLVAAPAPEAAAPGPAAPAAPAPPPAAPGAAATPPAAPRAPVADADGADAGQAQELDLPPAPSPALTLTSTTGLERLRDPAALADCLAGLPPADVPDPAPVAADLASYRGAPALAVVQDDGRPDSLLLTVVAATCSRADPGVLERVRVDRP